MSAEANLDRLPQELSTWIYNVNVPSAAEQDDAPLEGIDTQLADFQRFALSGMRTTATIHIYEVPSTLLVFSPDEQLIPDPSTSALNQQWPWPGTSIGMTMPYAGVTRLVLASCGTSGVQGAGKLFAGSVGSWESLLSTLRDENAAGGARQTLPNLKDILVSANLKVQISPRRWAAMQDRILGTSRSSEDDRQIPSLAAYGLQLADAVQGKLTENYSNGTYMPGEGVTDLDCRRAEHEIHIHNLRMAADYFPETLRRRDTASHTVKTGKHTWVIHHPWNTDDQEDTGVTDEVLVSGLLGFASTLRPGEQERQSWRVFLPEREGYMQMRGAGATPDVVLQNIRQWVNNVLTRNGVPLVTADGKPYFDVFWAESAIEEAEAGEEA